MPKPKYNENLLSPHTHPANRYHIKPEPMYIGIDPGQSGGLVALFSDGLEQSVVRMPDTERGVWEWFSGDLSGAVAVIEKVHSMPLQGVTSAFTFGRGYGFLRGCLTASGIPFEEITPQEWQKGLSIPPRKKEEEKPEFKNRLRAKAQQLFPKLSVWKRSKGEQLAVCDALLIAEFCRRRRNA